MTSKEELQKHIQLLNEIKSRYPILNDTIKYLEKYQQSLSNPTLLKCIKEWGEEGFDVDIYALEIAIHNCYIEFTIDLEDKTLFMEGEYNSFPYDVVHLLSKTLKALENNNETK